MYDNPISCLAKSGFVDGLHCVVTTVSTPLWDILIWMLIGIGLFFTLFSGVAQFRLFGRSIKSMLGSRNQHDDAGISGFQAFVTGLASRVGVGQCCRCRNYNWYWRCWCGILDVADCLDWYVFSISRVKLGTVI